MSCVQAQMGVLAGRVVGGEQPWEWGCDWKRFPCGGLKQKKPYLGAKESTNK